MIMSADEKKSGQPAKKLDTKFKPGQSGNPHGRPKRSKLLFDEADDDDAFEEELLKPVTVIGANGRKKKVSPLKLIAARLRKDSIDGDLKAIRMFERLTNFQFLSRREKKRRRLYTQRLLEQFMKDGENYINK